MNLTDESPFVFVSFCPPPGACPGFSFNVYANFSYFCVCNDHEKVPRGHCRAAPLAVNKNFNRRGHSETLMLPDVWSKGMVADSMIKNTWVTEMDL